MEVKADVGQDFVRRSQWRLPSVAPFSLEFLEFMTKFTLFMFGLLSFLAAILSQAACPVLNGTYHAVASKFPFHTLNIATEQPATEQRYKFERYEIVVDGKIRSLPRTQVLTSVVAAGPVENAMTTWKVVD